MWAANSKGVGVGLPKLLPQMVDMELWDQMFALFGFGLAWSDVSLLIYSFLLNSNFYPEPAPPLHLGCTCLFVWLVGWLLMFLQRLSADFAFVGTGRRMEEQIQNMERDIQREEDGGNFPFQVLNN
jgi:hypothetical protein